MDSIGARTQSRKVINYRSTMSGNNSFSVNSHSSTTRCREDFNADVQVLKYGALLSLTNYT